MKSFFRWIFLLPAILLALGAGAMGLLTLVYAYLGIRNWITGEYEYLSYGSVGWEIWQRFDFDVTGYAPGHPQWHPFIGWFFDIDRFWGAGIFALVLLIAALILRHLANRMRSKPRIFS